MNDDSDADTLADKQLEVTYDDGAGGAAVVTGTGFLKLNDHGYVVVKLPNGEVLNIPHQRVVSILIK